MSKWGGVNKKKFFSRIADPEKLKFTLKLSNIVQNQVF
jgi:hypothetical protein